MIVLSFHPCFEANINIICAARKPNEYDLEAVIKSNAVVLSQGCTEPLYQMVRKNCCNVFPNFDTRFSAYGKIGQIELFRSEKIPHPKSSLYYSTHDFFRTKTSLKIPLPFVFKFNWGGEGSTVFFVKTNKMFDTLLKQAIVYEKNGHYGFLIQQYINSLSKTLRVVIIGDTIISYWKVQPKKDIFGENLAKNAYIDSKVESFFLNPATKIVKQFCSNTGINLAGFDLIFSKNNLKPLMLEINYFFGRRGLGGSEQYYRLLNVEIKKWLKNLTIT